MDIHLSPEKPGKCYTWETLRCLIVRTRTQERLPLYNTIIQRQRFNVYGKFRTSHSVQETQCVGS